MSRMAELDLDRQLLDAVSEAIKETPEEALERRLDWIINELDDLCGMASNPGTVDLIEHQRVAVGQIVTRATLVASFLMARQPKPTLVFKR